jgi:hypothetical protein
LRNLMFAIADLSPFKGERIKVRGA